MFLKIVIGLTGCSFWTWWCLAWRKWRGLPTDLKSHQHRGQIALLLLPDPELIRTSSERVSVRRVLGGKWFIFYIDTLKIRLNWNHLERGLPVIPFAQLILPDREDEAERDPDSHLKKLRRKSSDLKKELSDFRFWNKQVYEFVAVTKNYCLCLSL